MSAQDTADFSIVKYLKKIERDFPVTEWKMYGFHIWPVIRISLGLKLTAERFFREENQIDKSRTSVVSDSVNSVYYSVNNSIRDSAHNQNAKQKYDVVFLNVSSTRYYKLDNGWYNPFSDSFINSFEKDNISSLVLEYPDVSEKIPRLRSSKYIGAGINLMNMNVIFEKAFEKNKLPELPEFNSFLKFVNQTPAFFFTKILRVANYSIYFRRILQKTKPSLIILEGYYSYLAMGMILAAKRENIQAADIQHGVQSENDFLYSDWENLSGNGYELLPDIFWCWSEKEKAAIDRWSRESKNCFALTGGNPVLEIDSEDNSIKNYTKEIESAKNSHPHSINILYTHQASFGLSDLLIDVISNSPQNWQWWIRLHPQYAEAGKKVLEQVSKCNFKNVFTEKVTSYPIGLLLKNMNLHVTESSSSVLEAEMLGVASVLIDEAGEILFKNQIDSGIAEYAANEKSFFESAERFLSKAKISPDDLNHARFKEGINFVKKIVHRKKQV